ncbi:universal stress protein [Candidatus Laterigemmans baculatus]|uniref:universal stress protein n=1 Tax=Candidatus Laterigemmans baculatus TaxID=2770505 RepID=UPI0013DC7F77|nr:universal stress protein [Candidatus Laterigemmans baculatus]
MRHILLASDGSSYAEEAAAFLARLPGIGKLQVTVLTVVDIPYVNDSFLSGEWLVEAIAHEKAVATENLKQIDAYFEHVPLTPRRIIREGARGDTIVEVAKEEQADLVVLGARGHSGVERLLLGSTSDYVATHAHCSVLVVRPRGRTEETRRGGGRPTDEAVGSGTAASRRPLRIAIGYEGSHTAEAALEEVGEVNWGSGAEFHVVSVVSYLAGLFHETDVHFEAIRNAAMETAGKAAEQLNKRVPNTYPHTVENPHSGEGLVRFVEEQQCDLIVVGEAPRNLVGRMLLGSVSRFVLRHAPCSVWIARNRAAHHAATEPLATRTATT